MAASRNRRRASASKSIQAHGEVDCRIPCRQVPEVENGGDLATSDHEVCAVQVAMDPHRWLAPGRDASEVVDEALDGFTLNIEARQVVAYPWNEFLDRLATKRVAWRIRRCRAMQGMEERAEPRGLQCRISQADVCGQVPVEPWADAPGPGIAVARMPHPDGRGDGKWQPGR